MKGPATQGQRALLKFLALPMLGAMACVSGGGAVAAAVAPAATAPFDVQVLYWRRSCGVSPVTGTVPVPVTAGKLLLSRNGRTPSPVTLTTATAQVTIAGTGPVQATLLLETPRVKVVEGASNAGTERIQLGDATVDNGVVTFEVLHDDVGNGHVNVLLQLERAALVAAQASPKALAQVTARVFDGDIGSRPQLHFDSPITIEVGQVDGVDAHWEPDAMAHEYGHFLLWSVAPDDPNAGSEHHIGESYPKRRTLAWTEGFPAAFAAVVNPSEGGQLYKNCEHYQGLADQPARPSLVSREAERYAQYNESRVGAATYQLIDYLGSGVAGLTRLLTALTHYSRDKHAAWTARDLRDLAVQEFETTPADHAAVDRIFMGQGISWQQGFSVSLDAGTAVATAADDEVVLTVTGPAGFDCRVKADVDSPDRVALYGGRLTIGVKAADGGLAWSGDDDCYLVSGDGKVVDRRDSHTRGIDHVDIPFPYLPNLAHWAGPFEVRAKYVCEYDKRMGPRREFKCPTQVKFHTVIGNPWMLAYNPQLMANIPFTLERNRDMLIARFTAQGDCNAGDAWTDCGF